MTDIPTTWGAAEYLAPRLSSSSRIGITRAGDALAVMFDEARVDLDAKIDGFNGWWTTALTFTTTRGEKSAILCRLRGVVRKTAASSATMIVSIGGQLATRHYGYGTTAGEEIEVELRFDKAILAAGRVTITLAIYAERQTFDDTVMLTVDSIDCASEVASGGTPVTEPK